MATLGSSASTYSAFDSICTAHSRAAITNGVSIVCTIAFLWLIVLLPGLDPIHQLRRRQAGTLSHTFTLAPARLTG